jgi:hypothetical protein
MAHGRIFCLRETIAAYPHAGISAAVSRVFDETGRETILRETGVGRTSGLGTRTLDILHLAAAIVLGADSFQTFDDRQKKLANFA